MTQMIVSSPDSFRPSKHAHRLVYETAWGMGHELYDHLMSGPNGNVWYSVWKFQNPDLMGHPRQLEARFVRKLLPDLVPQARAALAAILRTTTDPELAESIYTALCLDHSLIRGRGRQMAR